MDAVEDVSEIGLWVEAVQLSRFNDRHGACECFRTCISSGEEPVLSADSDRAQGAFSRVIVDSHTTICQEQTEGLPAVEAITESLGKIALAKNAQELLLGPGKEGQNLRQAILLTCRVTDVRRLAIDVALNVIEFADPVERLAGDLGLGRCPEVVEVTAQVCPASRLAQTRRAIGFIMRVKLGIALVAVSLKDAAGVGQMAQDVFFLPVRGEVIDRPGRG